MPKIKGKGNNLVASFDGKEKKDFGSLQDCSCLILISIKDKEECAGKYLEAIAKHATKTFRKTTFLLVDEPHWHNLKMNSDLTPEELKQKADQMGEAWFTENEKSFISLLNLGADTLNQFEKFSVVEKIQFLNEKSKNFQIKRWSDWLNLLDADRDKIIATYETNPDLKSALITTAEEFAKRHCREGSNNFNHYLKSSKDYLLEESYPIMVVGAQQGFDFIAYPGSISEVLKKTWQHFVQPSYSNKMHWLHINFKRTKQGLENSPSASNVNEILTKNSNEKILFSQNSNQFFAVKDLRKKIQHFPAVKQENIIALASAFLFLLSKEDAINFSTFNTYTEMLIGLAEKNTLEKLNTAPSINTRSNSELDTEITRQNTIC